MGLGQSKNAEAGGAIIYCDLTQSYSAKGGGVRTFIEEKRRYILENTDAHHCLIIPGAEDRMTNRGRLTTIEIASPHVPASPNYRLMLRSGAVGRALKLARPDLVECHDAYNLPWTALAHRRRHPKTALVAGYNTDFPVVYVEKVGARYVGGPAARWCRDFCYFYAGNLYSRFDSLYTLNEADAEKFRSRNVEDVSVISLGVDHGWVRPDLRDESLRARFNLSDDQPLLVYAGRIDREKKTRLVVDAFKRLPEDLGAALLMLGDGNEREALVAECRGRRVHFPGFISDRSMLARYLASSDIYVSAMEDETFGISIIEAQAAGLPVVGVNAGAMSDRVPDGLGLLGAPGDAAAFAQNIETIWRERDETLPERARNHVLENFSWRKTFDTLFNEIYPDAIARRGVKPRRETEKIIPFRRPGAATAGVKEASATIGRSVN